MKKVDGWVVDVPGEIELDQVLIVAEQSLHLLHHLLHARLKLWEAFAESQKASQVVGRWVLVQYAGFDSLLTSFRHYLGDLLQKHIKGRFDDLQVPLIETIDIAGFAQNWMF